MFRDYNEIICLGMGGSYSEIAKDKLFKKYDLYLYQRSLNSIKECIDYVDENCNAVAVLPVETSYKGIIRETIDNLIQTKNQNIQILAETIIPVNDCILSKTTEFYSIMGLIANPNALSKCKKFVRDEMPRQLNVVMAESMDESARLLNNYNLTYSIIGTEKTAQIYNLNILKEHVEDDKNNNRRFIVIGDGSTVPTGHDKTSIVLFLKDRPGVLMDIVQVFVKYHINITQINSKMMNNADEQAVFIDFDGHKDEERIQNLIQDLEPHSNNVRIIGSYTQF
ncbi:ACT domain-containing protein [bacterium]|nr:ACT domain-containing protein [bacterium]